MSILERYPMQSLRQMHLALWLAAKDLGDGKITEAEYNEIHVHARGHMQKLEREGRTASARALKQSLMTTAARLTNQSQSSRRKPGSPSGYPLRKT